MTGHDLRGSRSPPRTPPAAPPSTRSRSRPAARSSRIAGLLWLIARYRAGKALAASRRSSRSAERVSGLPGWAAVPTALAGIALLTALLGMYWDIALHIDQGRDAGPLANPAHYLILVGLFGVFAAGVLAMAMPRESPGRAPSIAVGRGWQRAVGGLLMAACGAFALTGFPLDDVWHRLFGQDVTLWGPTHLMLIGGAGMTLIGQAVLLAGGPARAPGAAAGRAQPVARCCARSR